MALFQQNEMLRIDVGKRDRPALAHRRMGRCGEQEGIVEQRQRLDVGRRDRQGEHHGIETAARQFGNQRFRLRFAQFEAQIAIAMLQERQNARQ